MGMVCVGVEGVGGGLLFCRVGVGVCCVGCSKQGSSEGCEGAVVHVVCVWGGGDAAVLNRSSTARAL